MNHLKEKAIKSNTFCVAPWSAIYQKPNGVVAPCCIWKGDEGLGNVNEKDIEEIYTDKKATDVKSSMLSGEKLNECQACYTQEDIGIPSLRESLNNHFLDKIDFSYDRPQFMYWDLRLSNLCNFKCRMCGSSLSSKWYQDEVDIFGQAPQDRALIHVNDYSKKNIYEYIDQFIEEVEEVYFAGGEPLMMDEHYMILEKLIEVGNTNCRIRYNTNFSMLKFKKWDVLELWKHFTKEDRMNVRIFASLDAMGNVAEYARKGTDWPKIEQNIKTVLEQDFWFDLSCTVSILNIFQIPQFVDRMIELGVPYYGIHLNNVLTFPEYYHLNSLPRNLKVQAQKNLYDHLETIPAAHREEFKHKYDVICNYFELDSQESRAKANTNLKSVVSQVDKYRKESFVEVYPYYKDWYESIKYGPYREDEK